MTTTDSLFFCAVGGSGMLPLAMIMKARGAEVSGSDRAHDQKRTPSRFAFIEKQGIALFPQNGSGLSPHIGRMIVSTAVEQTVPDYQAALAQNIPIVHRAALLAEIVNAAQTSLAVAGTSGKSTTCGMIGWILHETGRNPTIINGAVMKNFVAPEVPFASSVVGDPALIVSEVDESDGSIALFSPTIAVLNNIAIDHKTMDELRALFAAFIDKAKTVILNLDNEETAKLAALRERSNIITYSLDREDATLTTQNLVMTQDGATFEVLHKPSGQSVPVRLKVPGHHNVSNALAALAAALAVGVDSAKAAQALAQFTGTARRLDVMGSANGVTVIDDFAHNPDKIAASLRTLHQTEGRLLLLFQPHGYGPLALMRKELAACFASNLNKEDALFMPDPLYLGGTTSREVTSKDLIADISALGRQAAYLAKREECATAMIRMAQKGDRIVIMGARDDTLPELAREILFHLSAKTTE